MDENFVAFTLIDFENLIRELETEGLITSQESSQMKNISDVISERCGFIKG